MERDSNESVKMKHMQNKRLQEVTRVKIKFTKRLKRDSKETQKCKRDSKETHKEIHVF